MTAPRSRTSLHSPQHPTANRGVTEQAPDGASKPLVGAGRADRILAGLAAPSHARGPAGRDGAGTSSRSRPASASETSQRAKSLAGGRQSVSLSGNCRGEMTVSVPTFIQAESSQRALSGPAVGSAGRPWRLPPSNGATRFCSGSSGRPTRPCCSALSGDVATRPAAGYSCRQPAAARPLRRHVVDAWRFREVVHAPDALLRGIQL